MKPANQFFLTVLSVACIAFTIFMAVFLLADNRDLAHRNARLSEDIKQQTDINQKFLRCLVGIPQDPSRTTEQRLVLVDKCAAESRTL